MDSGVTLRWQINPNHQNKELQEALACSELSKSIALYEVGGIESGVALESETGKESG